MEGGLVIAQAVPGLDLFHGRSQFAVASGHGWTPGGNGTARGKNDLWLVLCQEGLEEGRIEVGAQGQDGVSASQGAQIGQEGRHVGTDQDDDHAPPSPAAYLIDHNDDPALTYERGSHEEGQLELLREGMSGLDARSRDILKRRFLAENKATLQELADEYGVSAERVRQIEANALKKMRALFVA